jgi:hypothetical protein
MHATFDMRSAVGKAYRACIVELTAHLGGDPTAPQRILLDQAARLSLLCSLASAELARLGAFERSGELRPAFDGYRKAAADLRDVLKMLGLERKEKAVPTLEQYLSERAEEEEEGTDDAAQLAQDDAGATQRGSAVLTHAPVRCVQPGAAQQTRQESDAYLLKGTAAIQAAPRTKFSKKLKMKER